MRRLLTLIAVLALTADAAVGQSPRFHSARPDWLAHWSPLRATAELARERPRPGTIASDPMPWGPRRIGLFWTAGNPGAIPFELDDRLTLFSASAAETDGEYRRPLDPEGVSAVGGEAIGWRTFGGAGAALGSAAVARTEAYAALSDFDGPYLGSPYVVLDTAGTDLGRTEAVLEGTVGWRLGAFGLGVALGYRAQKTRTLGAPVPRVLSAADPGATLGAVWVSSPALRLGVHARWRSHAERVLLVSVAAPSRVYLLQGYYEPPPQDLVGGHYIRRIDRDGLAFGISAGGRILDADWLLFAERGSQDERQHSRYTNDPALDTWATDAVTLGVGVSRSFGSAIQAVTDARYTTLTGEAARADLPDITTFESDDAVVEGAGELRFTGVPAVDLVARLAIRYEDRTSADRLEHVDMASTGWTTAIALAAVWRARPGLALSSAAGTLRFDGAGHMPDPMAIGPAFQRYVAPELTLGISDATGYAASAGLLWDVFPDAWLRVRVAWHSLEGTEEPALGSYQPRGGRSGWSVEIGAGVLASGSLLTADG